MTKRSFIVGTFAHDRGPGRKPLITAYTRTYNPAWDGCREYTVQADSGAEAKRIATEQRRAEEIATARLIAKAAREPAA